MNERFLTRVSAIGILICLISLYIITSMNLSYDAKAGEIDRSFVGKTVNVTGEITGVFESNGHVFFDLKDEKGRIKVVIWEDTIEYLKSNNVDVDRLKNGNFVNIIGYVQLYKGELEIIPVRGSVNIL